MNLFREYYLIILFKYELFTKVSEQIIITFSKDI